MMAGGTRLPDRFPVGTRYIVEGVPDKDGELTITSRYVVLPNGTEVTLPVTPRRLAQRLSRATTQRRSTKRVPKPR
jgi:hypothetical protein